MLCGTLLFTYTIHYPDAREDVQILATIPTLGIVKC
jgi:hypothetical protein